ncbi:RDD family protein [Pseudarcicella hirudinis]|uniref:RDD family protein n=1 Tax=Pseudarcicella hirudinis TaxID=1079859 RepID=A0A1I5RJL5_9BACT|nr:RDD family protein [Pseudarcicella hirudinis]SFP58570.1 RDD family protein [Pseudarcicella hirudinis]
MQSENSQNELFEEVELTPASTVKRFINYLIDVILFYILMLVIGLSIALFIPSLIETMANINAFADRILTLVLFALYMSVTEAIFKGKSLGKLITGTRAVNLDGSEISLSTAFGRGFSRAVPLCVFSAFGNPCNPWQDRWTDTVVIDG